MERLRIGRKPFGGLLLGRQLHPLKEDLPELLRAVQIKGLRSAKRKNLLPERVDLLPILRSERQQLRLIHEEAFAFHRKQGSHQRQLDLLVERAHFLSAEHEFVLQEPFRQLFRGRRDGKLRELRLEQILHDARVVKA